jgi:site-specific recombinase XerD
MRQGYAPYSGRNLLLVAAHVSRWLEDEALAPSELSVERVGEFAAHRQSQGYTRFRTARAVQPLLAYLRGIGIVPAPTQPVVVETSIDRLLREYAEYLVTERGLVATTIRGYVDFARRFIAAQRRLDWKRLTADQITAFVLRDSRQMSVGYCKLRVTSLRSFLRFLHVRGVIRHDLAASVPAVAGWRLAWLPKSLEPDQVDRLLRVCDPGSALGRRDAAIVRLLVRLGLRAGEVAVLRLDDIDWRAGEVVIHGKGRHESRLPLPRDVGRALVAYLRRGRPSSTSRQVFLGDRAPFRPLKACGVIAAARRAMRLAGVIAGGAHLLRHTAATQMLRNGASLDEVGHVLRHRHIDTTAIYAKVDHAALRTLARPWSSGAA